MVIARAHRDERGRARSSQSATRWWPGGMSMMTWPSNVAPPASTATWATGGRHERGVVRLGLRLGAVDRHRERHDGGRR